MNTRSRYSLSIIQGAILFSILSFPAASAHAYSAAPPTARTGSHLDVQSCSACHGSNQTNSSQITLTGLPTQWQPATTYNLTASIGSGSGLFGFEVTAENATTKQGTFTAGASNKVIDSAKHFVGHTNATSSTKSWNFSYTTPAAGAGAITFYVIGTVAKTTNYLKSFAVPESTTATPPTVASQPANQTVTAGQTASFTITASGTAPLSYQWQKAPSGSSTFSNVSGATAATYTTPVTVIGDSGSKFQCVVTNAAGSATSNAATLTVNPNIVAPAIASQPADQLVITGQTASFTVSATGTAPLSYQWQSSPSGSATFTNIAGATSASYTTAPTALTDSGSKFRCVVTNTAGSATSNAALLTVSNVVTPPTVTTQPAGQTVIVGQTASFSIGATGTAPLGYQWQSAPSGSSSFANISGATAATYVTPATVSGDSGAQFRCVVTNSAGTATSNAATLTVNLAPPTITGQPVAQSVQPGQTATFSVTASGTAPLGYQWQKAPSGSTTFTNVGGATAATYVTPATTLADSGATFRCVVSNSAGNATSSAATLTVTTVVLPPTITLQPVDQAAAIGRTVTFTVAATGSGPLTYQWLRAPAGTATFLNIPGATAATLTVLLTTLDDSGSLVQCIVTDGSESTTTDSAMMTVTVPTIVFTANPRDLTVLPGDTATFTIAVAGNPPFQYQWQSAAPGTQDFVNIPGAVLDRYAFAPGAQDTGRGFRCVVSNDGGTAYSAVALLTLSSSGGQARASNGIRVFPNPWMAGQGLDPMITFDNMAADSRIKIYGRSGEIVRGLDASQGSATWDLRNDLGGKVASGIYIYVITDGHGSRTRGKLAVIH